MSREVVVSLQRENIKDKAMPAKFHMYSLLPTDMRAKFCNHQNISLSKG